MRHAQTFLAIIRNHDRTMQTLAVISLLALLAIGGAAYSDQILTSQQIAQKAD
jgi:hypothetical protein